VNVQEQTFNPTLFKRVNDMDKNKNHEGMLTSNEFFDLFLNECLLEQDIAKP